MIKAWSSLTVETLLHCCKLPQNKAFQLIDAIAQVLDQVRN